MDPSEMHIFIQFEIDGFDTEHIIRHNEVKIYVSSAADNTIINLLQSPNLSNASNYDIKTHYIFDEVQETITQIEKPAFTKIIEISK